MAKVLDSFQPSTKALSLATVNSDFVEENNVMAYPIYDINDRFFLVIGPSCVLENAVRPRQERRESSLYPRFVFQSKTSCTTPPFH